MEVRSATKCFSPAFLAWKRTEWFSAVKLKKNPERFTTLKLTPFCVGVVLKDFSRHELIHFCAKYNRVSRHFLPADLTVWRAVVK